MKIKHIHSGLMFVFITDIDWKYGFNVEILELLKNIDTKSRSYNPQLRRWSVNKKTADSKIVEKLCNLEKFIEEEYNFDVEKWLKETFDEPV